MTSYKLKIYTTNPYLHTYFYTRMHTTHLGDAGVDLPFLEDITIPSSTTQRGRGTLVDMGVRLEMVDGNNNAVSFTLEPRSSIYRTQLRMSNGRGIIDSGYRGSIKVALDNRTNDVVQIAKHTSYFQILSPTLHPIQVELVNSINDLSRTNRNEDGFGSTGIVR